MCINEQILSAYVDGELGEIQSSGIKEHLEICSTCRKRITSLEAIRNQLKNSDIYVNKFVQENVWARLVHSTSTSAGLGFWQRRFILSPSFMLSISFLFFAVIGIGLFMVNPGKKNMLNITKNFKSTFYSEDIPIEIPIDNIENILAYFDISDEPLEVFIQLPDELDFIIQGEPRFLLKANYVAGP